jgi:tRNA U34 5-methylaminomethyl-2-thiouridine-forming methyltransferase MnmC
MGFGTGLNAWLTLKEAESMAERAAEGGVEAERASVTVDYTAVELHPVPEAVAARLNYTDDPRFEAMHAAPWERIGEPKADEPTRIDDRFSLRKIHGDLAEILTSAEKPAAANRPSDSSHGYEVIYYDAFAPDAQPELWTEAIFAQIFEATAPGGVLVTYCSKGDVKRALRAAGFEVERLPGAMGKRHMLRATKNIHK